MKNLLIHGVYLSVITVISFLFFNKINKYDKALTKSNETLEGDSKFFDKESEQALKELTKNINAEPKYAQYLTIANEAIKLASNAEITIDNIKKREPISKRDVDSIQKMVIENRKKYLSLIPREDVKQFSKSIPLDDSTKQDFNESSSNYLVMNKLNIIKNKNNKSKFVILNYCLDRSSGREHTGGDWFRVAIAPKKAVLIEGEKMEAEIYLAAYSKTNNNNISIKVKDNYLPIREGVALFEEKPNIGEHIIQATITIKNPFTGNTQTVKGELKYEVLPKCSRDCTKNQ
jgi:hypothetical protein